MTSVRRLWLDHMLTIIRPVMDALSRGELKKTMPLAFHADRSGFAPLEAFGRSMLGLAPWLECDAASLDPQERALQRVWREKALICLDYATNPLSPDFMNFSTGGQPLVDTAFLAHALLRAPTSLAAGLDSRVRRQLAEAFRASRGIPACNSNWLLFSAMVEAGLHVLSEPYDIMRVLYPLRVFQQWYQGDGLYGDGSSFHCDYYNSFVIHPMYVDIARLFAGINEEIQSILLNVLPRASRYATILERMIGPDGSYPIIGRSICYRFGCFQMLAQAALEHLLESRLSPAAVRCGLTAVIRRVMASPDLFDDQGFLQPGVYGLQPELAESYINIGSLYLCSAVFLPLGLAPSDAFWADADEDWSGKKVWGGGHIPIDHAAD